MGPPSNYKRRQTRREKCETYYDAVLQFVQGVPKL
jgi:hypothetical protein